MGKEKKASKERLASHPKGVPISLFFQETCLGKVTELQSEMFWVSGTLTLSSDAIPFQPFFRWMVDETNNGAEPPFDEALLNEDNWFIKKGDAEKVGISVPAVQSDGEIGWRWR
jgi:hypothetical protein